MRYKRKVWTVTVVVFANGSMETDAHSLTLSLKRLRGPHQCEQLR
jgi:hypothetical protein